MKIMHILLVFFVTLHFWGCGTSDDLPGTEGNGENPGKEQPSTGDPDPGDGEDPDPEAPGTPVLIEFNGSGLENVTVTRAVSEFPNNQQIGVIAAEYNPGSIDWTSYTDIQNAIATATSETNKVFGFTWATDKYWPFDGTPLVFLAYSPAANGTSVTLTDNNTKLALRLEQNTPDVMYASNNATASATPLTKVDNPVDLGKFEHALSKLTIRLYPGDTVNPNVRLDSLLIETRQRSATLDLLSGGNNLTLGAQETFTYELATSANYNFVNSDFTREIYVYPGTQDVTRLYVRLTDGIFTVAEWYNITDFENLTHPGSPLIFERAVNLRLSFKVVGLTIEQPTDEIHLEGELLDWDDRGELELNIK